MLRFVYVPEKSTIIRSPDMADADVFLDDDDGELPSPDLPDELEE